MQDRIATMMIIRSLRDIADELKAMRQELHRQNRSNPRHGSDFQQGFSDQSGMEDAFEPGTPKQARPMKRRLAHTFAPTIKR
jgi:hypothetical protein